jgi:hypothetical protein
MKCGTLGYHRCMQLSIGQASWMNQWMKLVAIAAVAASTAACEDNSADNTKVVDAVVLSTTTINDAISADPDSWLTQNTVGLDVLGTAESPLGGSVEVSGWRVLIEEDAATGFHVGYTEKLFFNFANFGQNDLFLAGGITLSRHSIDYGPAGGSTITDASRTTEYRGTLAVSGAASGSFTLDIHGVASGTTEWTCGTVNEEDHGQGACFE